MKREQTILTPFVTKGMTIFDYGCGNGFFPILLSKMVGYTGKVYSMVAKRIGLMNSPRSVPVVQDLIY